jgi:hypothetical protein
VDVKPRTVIDPRATYRYWRTLTSRLVKLQCGLAVRAVVTTDEDDPASSADRSGVRSIA